MTDHDPVHAEKLDALSVQERNRSYHAGIRAAITWLHRRAEKMVDPHAKGVLHSAAFNLGLDKPNSEATHD